PVWKYNAPLKEVMPSIPNLNHQSTLLDRIISKLLCPQILLQCVRSHWREAQFILLDSLKREAPLIFAEINLLLRDLLVVKLHGETKQLLEVVSVLLQVLPLLELCRIE